MALFDVLVILILFIKSVYILMEKLGGFILLADFVYLVFLLITFFILTPRVQKLFLETMCIIVD